MVFFVMTIASMHAPPWKILFATGLPGGTYHSVALEYQAELARQGITMELLQTPGSPGVLRALHDVKTHAVAGFVQGGIARPEDQRDLESLGTVFYEPLWLFARDERCAPVCSLPEFIELLSRRVSIGGPDSGTQVLAALVLESLGIPQSDNWQRLSSMDARDALLAGNIDAVFLVDAWEAPGIRQLLADPAIRAMDYPIADALIEVSPTLHHVVLPRGARSFPLDLPPRDINLVAPKASLMVRQDLHPAIKRLLLEAMRRLHARSRMFTKSGEFPAPEAIGLRLSDVAQQFYNRSEPFYYRFLPYWIADLIAVSVAMMVPVYALFGRLLAQLLTRRRASLKEISDAAQKPG
ncbi:MAG: hypothetical protein C5B60_07495 [Chloroflexi bacterium]|nr:MAG: hypothetical protein C5B60_07495 [Chloroflexota bacterium]